MRLTRSNDKNLMSNLNILKLCSKYETVEYFCKRALESQKLSDPKNYKFRDFLEEKYIEESRLAGKRTRTAYGTDTLSAFEVPSYYDVHPELRAELKRHNKVARELSKSKNSQLEYNELLDLLSNHILPRDTDLRNINSFLNSSKRSHKFQNFAKQMKSRNAFCILLNYRNRSKKFVKENGIDSTIESRLDETFGVKFDDTIKGFNSEFKARLFSKIPKIFKKTAFLALTAGIGITAASGFVGAIISEADAAGKTDVEPPAHVDENSNYNKDQYSEAIEKTIETNNPTEPILETVSQSITTDNNELPISNSTKISDYTDAGKDFMQKASEIYKYNTGEDIDLSSMGLKNIGYAETTIYTATLGDEVYRFSGMSTNGSNNTYLENVLASLGANVTKSNGHITYITSDGETSIAICDSSGNPVKSGNIMNSNGMYKQKFISAAKNDLEENGIDIEGMTDEQFMAYYLFYNNDQNENLSRALGPLVPLARQMNDTFITKKTDPYTIQVYADLSNKIGNDFNDSTKSKGDQTYDTDYTTDTSSDHDYDYDDYSDR